MQKVQQSNSANDKPTRYLTGKQSISGAESYNDLEVGTIVEGILRNTHVREGEYGPSSTHYLETETENIGINGSTILDDLMSQVPRGSLVRVTYDGLGKKAKGKRPPFLFTVEFEQQADEKVLAD